MKGKKTKIVLSLLIAMAFILPTAPLFADGPTDLEDAGVNQNKLETTTNSQYTTSINMAADEYQSGMAPLDWVPGEGWPIDVDQIMIPSIISPGTYPVTVRYCRPDYYAGDTIIFDGCLDPDYTLLGLTAPVPPEAVEVYAASNCTHIFFFLNNTIGWNNYVILIDILGVMTIDAYAPPPGVDVTHAGPGGYGMQEIRIPRSMLPGNCNQRRFSFHFEIDGGILDIHNYDGFKYDCIDAEIKKFLEIYKWVDEPGDPDVWEEIYCTDFEEPCDIYDEWATWDLYPEWGPNGAIDTWTWSDKRSNSPDHSFHSTSFDTYLGNQFDILELNMDGAGIDVSGYTTVELTFSHWMEGDAIVVNDTTIIQDGGYVEYSFDGSAWVTVSEVFYDNDWTDESFDIDTTGENTLFIRFVFFSDPAFCYEGWYIDDVCLEGLIPGTQDSGGFTEFVADSHSWEQIMDDECLDHTFLDEWEAEEGRYLICTWFQVLDDCHFPMWTSDNQFCIEVEVADVICIEDTALYVDPVGYAWEGDDVSIFSDVTNLGTIDAEDVQVRVTVTRGEVSLVHEDDVDSGPYNDDDYYHYRFGCANTGNMNWHMSTVDSFSGANSWAYYDELTGYYHNDVNCPPASGYTVGANLAVTPPTGILSVDDVPLQPELRMQARYAFDTGGFQDYLTFGVFDNSTGFTFSYSPGGLPSDSPDTFFTGVQDTWGEISTGTVVIDLIAAMTPYIPTYFNGDDLRVSALIYTDDAGNDPGTGWSGVYLDDFELWKIQQGEEIIFQETQIIDILNASTFWVPGEMKTVEFIWEDAGVGQYVIVQEVLGETGTCDPDQLMPYFVINYEQDLFDGEIELIDHTCTGPGHWMVDDCCGGSIWIGDPQTTMYGDDWDDSLYIAPGGNVSNVFNGMLDFWTWYQINDTDMIYLEGSDDDGLHFYYTLWSATGDSHVGPAGEEEWIHVSGIDVTGMDQVRFRFVSDSNFTNRGFMFDNISIDSVNGAPFFDDCDSMDNFYNTVTCAGVWWFSPDQYKHWWDWYYPDITLYWAFGGADWPYDPAIAAHLRDNPIKTWGNYDPLGYPSLWVTPHEIYPQNTDSSFNWKIDTDKVFYGWYQAYMLLDQAPGDEILFQYSKDGENFNTLANPAFWRGIFNAPVSDAMMNDELTIRMRFISDGVEATVPYLEWDGVSFNDLKFLGMKDLNAPVTTVAMQGTFDQTYHYYTSEVGITLTATDDVTGVAATYYILDGTEYEYTRPFVVEDDGEHTLCFYSVDNEGNVETQKCVENFVIDQTGPDVEITGPEPGIYLMGNKILNSDKYIFLFGGVTISASVTIDGAPLATVEFYMNDELFAEDTSSPYQMTCTLKNSGAATFKVIARDVLGESDQDTLEVDTYLKIF
jgi:hypothetical protein